MSIYKLTLSDQARPLLLSQSSRFSLRIFSQSSVTGGGGGLFHWTPTPPPAPHYLCCSPVFVKNFFPPPRSRGGGGTLSLGPEPALSSPGYGMGGSKVRSPVMARNVILYTRSDGAGANSSSIPRAYWTGCGVNRPPPSSTEVCACTVCHGENLQ